MFDYKDCYCTYMFLQRPVINDPCPTLPFSLYIINASVVFMNGSQTNYVSNNIMDTSGDSMGRFNVSYNYSFDEELVPNAIYVFAINSGAVQPPSKYLLCLYSTHVCIRTYVRICMADTYY